MLDKTKQPITLEPFSLLIGVAAVSIDQVDLGSVTEASLELQTDQIDTKVGYPSQVVETETSVVNVKMSVTAEEVGSDEVLLILQNLLNDLACTESDTFKYPTSYSLNLMSPYAGGGDLSIAADVQLIPEVEINWQDNWSSIKYNFECITASMSDSVSTRMSSLLQYARLHSNQRSLGTLTKNVNNLGIGKPRVTINGSSIGAVQSAKLTISGKYKQIQIGYPKFTRTLQYQSSEMKLEIVAEEAQVDLFNSLTTPSSDILLELALVDGGCIQLDMPNSIKLRDLNIATVNDWIGCTRKFKLQSTSEGIPPITITRITP